MTNNGKKALAYTAIALMLVSGGVAAKSGIRIYNEMKLNAAIETEMQNLLEARKAEYVYDEKTQRYYHVTTDTREPQYLPEEGYRLENGMLIGYKDDEEKGGLVSDIRPASVYEPEGWTYNVGTKLLTRPKTEIMPEGWTPEMLESSNDPEISSRVKKGAQ